ncbi:hypothetical protein ADK60_37520 [Streptomyces sp. XY431]|uniref:hypothetical protein n=1 Tax=Streptomyces sp. XY431 TaxID=1415562 RepID=UPI0006AE04C9|nr:hypothetical protein [Streptomyces sp. XY431]KOV10734.1 hypothetical protein ADK60_37520 [Streptomyces sp. XY431]
MSSSRIDEARSALADDLEFAAVNAEAGAVDSRTAAADPDAPPTVRSRARAAATLLADEAAGLRADAAAIRDGVDPALLGYPVAEAPATGQ